MATRVAVVGSGLAGLTTAYLLRREGCEVYLLEKSEKLGFHSASVNVPVVNGGHGEKRSWVVDVPMRSFQGGYYPLLISLYRHIGMTLVPTHYTFSFSTLSGQRQQLTYLIHTGASGRHFPSLPSGPTLSNLSYLLYTGVCYVLVLFLAFCSWHRLLPGLLGPSSTLQTLAEDIPVLKSYIEYTLVPIFSAVGTMTEKDVLESRLSTLLAYIHAGVGTPHYTLGTSTAGDVARRLAESVEGQGAGHVRLGVTISGIEQVEGCVRIVLGEGEELEEEIVVDQVVFATQASSARRLLGMLLPSLHGEDKDKVQIMMGGLEEVEYRETIVVTHRDQSVLPRSEDVKIINLCQPALISLANTLSSPSGSRGSIPFFLPTEKAAYTMATHVISPPSHLEEERVLQTTNPVIPIDDQTVLGVSRLERALPLRDSSTLERLHPSTTFVHLAGSYAYPGIPLLEGCVGSARAAAAAVLHKDVEHLGRVDWTVGEGSIIGRLWRM